MDRDDAILVMGRIGVPYGVQGWVRIQWFCESPQSLIDQRQWWLRLPGSPDWQPVVPSGVRLHGSDVLARLPEVADRDDAERLRGGEIGVARSALPALARDEYYWTDLVGLEVVNRDQAVLGRVTDVAEFGAHPVLRVGVAAASEGAGPARETLIPLVGAFVDRIDLAGRRIEVDWQADY